MLAIVNSGAMHIVYFWVRVTPQPSGAAILNPEVPMALNLRSGRKNEIMRMIPFFQTIAECGATAVRAQSLTFYAPPRDSIAIPASLMRGDYLKLGHKINFKRVATIPLQNSSVAQTNYLQ